MARKLSKPERRLYPWRVDIDSIACIGSLTEAHLFVTFRELTQRDPAGTPFEWSCPVCGVTKPSIIWDSTVPVPPHQFQERTDGPGCRVCWQPERDRGWHPEPLKPRFDPLTVRTKEPIVSMDGWGVVLDDTLAYMEAYCDHGGNLVAVSTETWRTVGITEAAFERFFDDSIWETRAGTGMRWLTGVPEFDEAMRAYAAERGDAVVVAKDQITQLYEEAKSLALQAASIGADGDEEQRKILTGRYLQVRAAFMEVEQRLERLRSELDTAALSIMTYT